MAKKLAKCPICSSSFDASTKTYPFCSVRCRGADLGSWLGDSYRIADPPDQNGTDWDTESSGAKREPGGGSPQ